MSKIDPIAGVVESVQGTSGVIDGRAWGFTNELTYTVRMNLPEGEAVMSGLSPHTHRWPSTLKVFAHPPGAAVLGARVGNAVQLMLIENPVFGACP